MSDLSDFFNERCNEIESFVRLLESLDAVTRSGPPKLQGATDTISTEQQRILYSSVYLQLYNLVEATVTRCARAVTIAAESSGRPPASLSLPLRREWVRFKAKTHDNLGIDKRLNAAVAMFETLVGHQSAASFDIDLGGGGGWDDESISRLSDRIGCALTFQPTTVTAIKRHLLDGQGALKVVRRRRNELAHGSISFVECSDNGLFVLGVGVSDSR